MSPLQTALVAATCAGVASWAHLKRAVLVEVPGAPVQHAKVIRLLLEEIAPDCELFVLHAQISVQVLQVADDSRLEIDQSTRRD